VEVSDKPTVSTRRARRRSTLSTSRTDLNSAGLTDISQQPEPQTTQTIQTNEPVAEPKEEVSQPPSSPRKEVLPKKVDKRKIKAVFSAEEVAKHNTEGDCWMIIKGGVYDISTYFPYHPGGKRALLKFGGKDGTENVEFHSSRMMYLLDNYFYIGRLDSVPEGASCVIS